MFGKSIYVFLFVTISLLISCTSKNDQATSNDNEKKTISLFIWSNYVSEETLKAFEKKYNMKVVISNYSSNEELLSKLQAGATGYDVIVPSDYMVTIMAKLKLLAPLKKELIGNAKNIDPKFLNLPYDNRNEFSLPYGWTTTGIAINSKYFKGEIKSWRDFFESKQMIGKISLLDDTREVFAAALKANGYSVNSRKTEEISKAKDYLKANKKQIKAFSSESIELLLNGEVWASQMYSSDALQAQNRYSYRGGPVPLDSENPSADFQNKSKGLIKYIIPTEGCTLAVDNLAIPVSAKNIEGANLLINFLISQESNLAFVKKVYSGPVLVSTKHQLPEELRNNPSLFPEKDILAKLEMLTDLEEMTSVYDRFWTELKSE
jgi:spermidine/putrescine transport system substrate-binding protein